MVMWLIFMGQVTHFSEVWQKKSQVSEGLRPFTRDLLLLYLRCAGNYLVGEDDLLCAPTLLPVHFPGQRMDQVARFRVFCGLVK